MHALCSTAIFFASEGREMFRRLLPRLVKGDPPTAVVGGKSAAAKLATDEKFGQAALEYVYEQNRPDYPKSRKDIEEEQALSIQYDRVLASGDIEFDCQLARQIRRSSAVLASLPAALRAEALILNSEMPPLAYIGPH